MDIESDAGEENVQEATAGERSGDLVQPPAFRQSAAEKENMPDLPERRGLGTDNK